MKSTKPRIPKKVESKKAESKAESKVESKVESKKVESKVESKAESQALQDSIAAANRMQACQIRQCPAQVKAGEAQKHAVQVKLRRLVEDLKQHRIESREEFDRRAQAIIDQVMTSEATKQLAACSKAKCAKELKDLLDLLAVAQDEVCDGGRDQACVDNFRKIAAVYDEIDKKK